jgi:hypothetical protein
MIARYIFFLVCTFGYVSASFDYTCDDVSIDDHEIITAICEDGSQRPTPANLDLNNCLSYDGSKITV